MYFKFLLAVLLGIWSAIAVGQADEAATARVELKDQLSLLEDMRPYVEKHDAGRVMVLQDSVRNVLRSIDESGLAQVRTIQAYQNFLITFKYSEGFFKKINSPRISANISRLTRTTVKISERVFGNEPYLNVTENVFRQMHRLFMELIELPVSDELRDQLTELVPDLGNTVGIAGLGDRPEAFRIGIEMCKKIRGIYGLLDDAMAADAGFDVVINIFGLNEFYADFAQI